MDDIVKAALKKWPNVPACFDWLALDARGDWYMRDDRIQAAGPFPQVKGSRLLHEKLREFIGRNYEAVKEGAQAGCWYFQNGPQRVYVELEAAPWILGVQRDGARFLVSSHTGLDAGEVAAAWLDEHGRLFLATAIGLGLVRSLDMDAAADAIEAGLWSPQEIEFAQLPARYGFVLSPARQSAGKEKAGQ